MNRHTKVFAATVGLAIITISAVSFAIPGSAAAKWFSRIKVVTADTNQPTAAAVSQAEPAGDPAQPGKETAAATDSPAYVPVIETVVTKPVTVAVDADENKNLQEQADKGLSDWMLSPVEVVRHNAVKYGFTGQDRFSLLSQTFSGASGTGEAQVLVTQGDRYYRVYLTQPDGGGQGHVWAVCAIEEVRVAKTPAKRVDVGPGVEGLDYSKVLVWQQNVDEGRELWRLDPLQVARQEGKSYGFTDRASFTLVKRVNNSSIARHGQVDMKVEQDGKTYTMILVRPFGSDEGAIWTVYSVERLGKPADQPQDGQVIYETDKYAGWKWRKGAGNYPQDMTFAAIVGKDGLSGNKELPSSAAERLQNIDYSRKAVLLAYLGTVPTGGYRIGIEKVTLSGNHMEVKISMQSPAPGDITSQVVSQPADYLVIDRSYLDIWGGVTVTFVDPGGRVLSQSRVSINHHK